METEGCQCEERKKVFRQGCEDRGLSEGLKAVQFVRVGVRKEVRPEVQEGRR